jgi:hypothetical protein
MSTSPDGGGAVILMFPARARRRRATWWLPAGAVALALAAILALVARPVAPDTGVPDLSWIVPG